MAGYLTRICAVFSPNICHVGRVFDAQLHVICMQHCLLIYEKEFLLMSHGIIFIFIVNCHSGVRVYYLHWFQLCAPHVHNVVEEVYYCKERFY